jgi:hypothetical protein
VYSQIKEGGKKMKIQHVCLMALVLMAGTASAAIVPTTPFTGDLYEGFENVGSMGSHPGPYPIMGGGATFNDLLANSLMVANSLYSGISGLAVYPWNGNLMGGSVTGWAAIAFETPVSKFGGYLGSADDLSGGYVTFKDANGVPLETQSLQLPMGDWAWYGWESDTPIGSIEIYGATNPGFGVTYDDLVATTVPEPASMALLGMGVLALVRRRASK